MMDIQKAEALQAEEGSYAITAMSIVGLGFILTAFELIGSGGSIIPTVLFVGGLIISAICLLKCRYASHVALAQTLSGIGVAIGLALLAGFGVLLFIMRTLSGLGGSW